MSDRYERDETHVQTKHFSLFFLIVSLSLSLSLYFNPPVASEATLVPLTNRFSAHFEKRRFKRRTRYRERHLAISVSLGQGNIISPLLYTRIYLARQLKHIKPSASALELLMNICDSLGTGDDRQHLSWNNFKVVELPSRWRGGEEDIAEESEKRPKRGSQISVDREKAECMCILAEW